MIAADTSPVDGLTPREQIAKLVAELVRTAAPRLGKTAVARIANPVADAVVAVRAEMAAQPGKAEVPAELLRELAVLTEEFNRIAHANDTEDDTSWRYSLGMTARRARDRLIALREQLPAAPQPVERDEVIETEARLALVPLTALIRDADSITFEKAGPLDSDLDVWAMPGGEGRFRPSLPVRVLDLGITGERA